MLPHRALTAPSTSIQCDGLPMLTAQGCLARRERLWGVLSEQIEWVLIADPRHVHYFSNFWINPLSFSSSERAFLILDRGGKATLICDNFARRSVPSEPFVDDEIVGKWYDHRHSVVNRDALLVATLERVKDRLPPDRGRVEKSALPLNAFAALGPAAAAEGSELGSIIHSLRRSKEADEISLLQRCLRAAEAGHARALEVVGPGVTELDVYREVQSVSLEVAGRPVLVYGDFRAARPDHPKVGGLPTDYTLQDGDLFILDVSVVMDGYRGDTTNTMQVGERSRRGQSGMFQACRSAIEKGEAALGPGVPASRVYEVVSSELEKAGHGPLVHHAGHGIGLSHLEPPILVSESEDELSAGDVVTLEPGLYVEGIGGMRVEHNYLITAEASVRLSHHSLSLK